MESKQKRKEEMTKKGIGTKEKGIMKGRKMETGKEKGKGKGNVITSNRISDT